MPYPKDKYILSMNLFRARAIATWVAIGATVAPVAAFVAAIVLWRTGITDPAIWTAFTSIAVTVAGLVLRISKRRKVDE